MPAGDDINSSDSVTKAARDSKSTRSTKSTKGTQTRQSIRTKALTLFNEAGACFSTTHDIAAAVGISPGNLYYHFRSREEIILEIFDEFVGTSQGYLSTPANFTGRSPVEALIPWFHLMWDYRFLYRERILLIDRDPVLRERWMQSQERSLKLLMPVARLCEAQGIVNPLGDDAHVSRILTNSIIIGNSFISNFGDGSHATREAIEWGFRQIAQYWLTYHTEKWKPAVLRYLNADLSESFVFRNG